MRVDPGMGGLLYVVGNRPRESQLAFGSELGAQVLYLDELTAAALRTDPTIVFDLDLRKIDVVRKLKSLCNRQGPGCKIFLVDTSSRVATVHGRVLGASAILSNSAKPSEIHAAIKAHFGITQREQKVDAAVRDSINSGVMALKSGFAAIDENLMFNLAGATATSDRIVDAIGLAGAGEWLATVKGYHIGTYQHCLLVTGVLTAFASGAGMSRRDVVRLTLAGLLHDIGKAAVPIEILDKPGALTPEEQVAMRQHPVIGYKYLKEKSHVDADIQSSVRHHHEYLDGSGYPDGLSGGEIDDITRIVTVCDIYAALIERRSYKEPKAPAQALIILNAMADSGKLETSLVRELGRIMLSKQAA